MTGRGWAALAVLATAAVSALSLGNALYLYIALLLALIFAYALITCLWARLTAQCGQQLTSAAHECRHIAHDDFYRDEDIAEMERQADVSSSPR